MTTETRNEQYAAITGVVAIGLLVLGAVLFDFYEYLPEADDIQFHLEDNSTRVQVAGYVGVLAAFFFYWFASSLRAMLRAAEGGTGRVSNIAFGGAIGAGTLMAGGFVLLLAAGARAGTDAGISGIAATTTYDIYGLVFGSAVPLALGVMIAAFSVIALRTRVVPQWLGWASVVIAVGSISPLSYIFVALDALWVVWISALLFLRGSRTVTSPTL